MLLYINPSTVSLVIQLVSIIVFIGFIALIIFISKKIIHYFKVKEIYNKTEVTKNTSEFKKR